MDAHSIWYQGHPPKRHAALDSHRNVDVAVMGGGITGLITAYLLLKQGASVAVVEAYRVGEGSTGHSTGNLYEIVSVFDHDLGERIRPVITARRAGVDLIEQIAAEWAIDCAFTRVPWYLFSETQDDPSDLKRVQDAAARVPLALSSDLPPAPFYARKSLRLDGQAQFNPLWFAKGIANAIVAKGGLVFEDSVVTQYDADTRALHTAKGTVSAQHIVMATHVPKGVHLIHALLAPYREYGIAAPIDADRLAPGIYWTTGEAHHSTRVYTVNGETYLIVVGGSHKTGQDDDTPVRHAELERFAKDHFGRLEVRCRWSAQNYTPADGLPYIGNLAGDERVHIATGFAADGLTYGAVAATILADAVRGVTHPCAEIFAAERHRPLAAVKDAVKENLNVLREYLRDMPQRSHAEQLASLQPGEACVVDVEGEKIAAARTLDGTLHCVSAVCTHMKCIVRWNAAERSWDCPCHGSRFAPDGGVIEGPALTALAALSAQKD